MFLLVWIVILVYFGNIETGYVEILDTTTCDSCLAMLTCRDLSSVVAILDVEFYSDSSNETLTSDNTTFSIASFPPMHPRDCINHRCSGANHCSFILTEDCPGSELLGQGNLSIKYACISEDRIKRYCNSDIVLYEKYSTGSSVGFIHNPGYPRFYSGQKECKWSIQVRGDQRISITIVDISLIVDNVASPTDCTDVLEIRDTGQVIYSTCRMEYPPKEIVSASENIEIILIAKNSFNPRRGVFLRYSVVGCSTLPIPQDAYLVFRTDEVTVLSCCLGYQFPDTGTRIKYVKCIGAFWNITLPIPSCQKSPLPSRSNRTKDLQIRERKAQIMSTELLPPVFIILTLFLINGLVLFYIHKARKRQEVQNVRDEELGSFTLSPVET